MTPSTFTYELPTEREPSVLREDGIESGFIGKLQGLKYEYRRDITNRATQEQNFREKFEALNRVRLTDAEFARLLDEKCIDDDGNGFVWHTTGSGKTLTSFKASTLLKENDHIHKCVFVVDRKDLDRQTRENWSRRDKTSSEGEARRVNAGSANQFNKFQEGCVEKNTSTAALLRHLLSEDYADIVIISTIQKFGLAINDLSE